MTKREVRIGDDVYDLSDLDETIARVRLEVRRAKAEQVRKTFAAIGRIVTRLFHASHHDHSKATNQPA